MNTFYNNKKKKYTTLSTVSDNKFTVENLTDGTTLEMDGYNVNCVLEKA